MGEGFFKYFPMLECLDLSHHKRVLNWAGFVSESRDGDEKCSCDCSRSHESDLREISSTDAVEFVSAYDPIHLCRERHSGPVQHISNASRHFRFPAKSRSKSRQEIKVQVVRFAVQHLFKG